MGLSILVHKGRSLVPGRGPLLEATGFVLLGLGIFLSLACLTYDPLDYSHLYQNNPPISNLAGPLGASMAQKLLGNFGIMGLLWPPLLCVWGAALVLGFSYVPRPKIIVGFMGLTILGSAFIELQMRIVDVPRPSFGFGGRVGWYVATTTYRNLGFGGTTIALVVCNLVCLVLSGVISFSRTAAHLRLLGRGGAFILHKVWEVLFPGEKSDEQLIMEALRKEAVQSKKLVHEVKARTKAKASSKGEELAADVNLEDSSSEEIHFQYNGTGHERPGAHIFSTSAKAKPRKSEFEKMARRLTAQLAEFKVQGKITKIVEGPVVTTFEFEPVPGTKLSKITALAQDLTRLLQAKSLRILAPIPGKKVCGFEVPNEERRHIGFAELASHKSLKSARVNLPLAMGLDVFGNPVIEDLAKMPHLLVAGSTGSGKSVFMNSVVASLICRHTAKDLRFIMVDPKMVELAVYNDLPHMACPVVSDPSVDAKTKLDALVAEMEERFKKMQAVGARNIESFNETIRKKRKVEFPSYKGEWVTMPFIVLIIDELADMMMVLGKEVEVPITRLAQKARAAGIHLIIATQRPSAEVVTGLIKANFPTRVAFRVLSGLDSRTILDQNGAETLIGQGDMLYMSAGGVRRLHGAFLSEEEVQKMVKVAKGK